MATGDIPTTLRSNLGRAANNPHFQAIDAHYFNITDIQAWPIAGLLVLLDGKGQPVRAELHLYDELPSHVQEAAVRQSRLVLQEGYVGIDPVPLRILETQQMREAMDVRLPPPGERLHDAKPLRWQPYAAGGLAMVVLAGLIWLAFLWMRPDGEEVASSPDSASSPTEIMAVATNDAFPAAGGDQITVAASTGSVAPVTQGESGAELAPSLNARPDLGIGMRVAIVPGLQLALRSEPGADAGEIVGAMGDGEVATIIGGPRTTQGTSDIIVWWLVQLDDGTQAWAAANTSEQTLLVPAP